MSQHDCYQCDGDGFAAIGGGNCQRCHGSGKEARSDDGTWLWERCYACGHRLAYASTACAQCGQDFDGRNTPKTWPEQCACDRCATARRGVSHV